jgi:lipid-A-disaccharide synthase
MAVAALNSELCVLAGEFSGDLLAAAVVKDLRALRPDVSIWGMTGPALRDAGVETLLPLETQSVMGFTAVLKALPRVLKAMRTVVNAVLSRRPSVVLLVDYPGFNLRIAAKLRKRGYTGKIVQMVSPSVWAHSPGRIKTMARDLDLLLTIFPFEPRYFEGSGLRTVYIGNPVAERVREFRGEAPELIQQLAAQFPLVGLFPGSRAQDLEGHLPIMLEAARMLVALHPNLRFILSCAHKRLPSLLHTLCQPGDGLRLGENLFLIDHHHNLSVMKLLRGAISKSGTMTLELGISGVPTVCGYAISTLNAAIVKLILRVRLPYYCIVNILRDREVFPERVWRDFKPAKIVDAMVPLLDSDQTRAQCLRELETLQSQLAEPPHPSRMAAEQLAQLLTF